MTFNRDFVMRYQPDDPLLINHIGDTFRRQEGEPEARGSKKGAELLLGIADQWIGEIEGGRKPCVLFLSVGAYGKNDGPELTDQFIAVPIGAGLTSTPLRKILWVKREDDDLLASVIPQPNGLSVA